MQVDPHHCRCYRIHKDYIEDFKNFLLKSGFKDGLQEDHGQLYGYMLRVDQYTQFHIKVMPNGRIESEMEPPQDYPFEHINQEYSYSAHEETRQILAMSRVRRFVTQHIPSTCRRPRIKKSDNPTHVGKIIAGVAVGIVAAAILRELLKDDEDDD